MKVNLGSLAILVIDASAQQSMWGQCGGQGWTGQTPCVSGAVCTYQNEWYSHCIAGELSLPLLSVYRGSLIRTVASYRVSPADYVGQATIKRPDEHERHAASDIDYGLCCIKRQWHLLVGQEHLLRQRAKAPDHRRPDPPQRVPRAYWSQRLQMAKAMGLNTILSYVYWQDIERFPGQFDPTGRNDVAA
ncbi:fungal cellulose binding domain-containing protein [Apiospora marii]|uniref:Fungal cellulose binding domain-containing protein n=1 Tax=Apiospora marii TaxID=335849 RepID=A0ABR1S0F4_9PEZI